MKRLNFIPKPEYKSWTIFLNVPSLPYDGTGIFNLGGVPGSSFSINWGDGNTTNHFMTTESQYSHTYSTTGLKAITLTGNVTKFNYVQMFNRDFQFNIATVPPFLERLIILIAPNMFGNITTLPQTLTELRLMHGLYTGNLQNLPAGLLHCELTGIYTNITGTIDNLPASLSSLSLGITNNNSWNYTLIYSINNLPPDIISLNLSGHWNFTGAISNLPANLQSADLFGLPSSVTGDLSEFPASMYYLRLTQCAGITGDISTIPQSLTHFEINGPMPVYGEIATIPSSVMVSLRLGYADDIYTDLDLLPPTLTHFTLDNMINSYGDLSNLPLGLTYFHITKSNGGLSFSGGYPSWPGLVHFVSSDSNLSESFVDAILADVVAYQTNNTYIYLAGASNSPPSAQGLIDKATLISRGYSVTTN